MFTCTFFQKLPAAFWLAALVIATPAWSQNYERGLSAYNRLDYETALREWSESAIAGDVKAQFGVGMLYDFGHGVPQDPEATVVWCRWAAEQGHPSAQLFLANSYEQGRGVGQNYAAAHRWYLNSARQGEAKAQNNLGVMYENGHGLPIDLNIAIYWYEEAARNGNRNARANLHRLKTAGTALSN